VHVEDHAKQQQQNIQGLKGRKVKLKTKPIGINKLSNSALQMCKDYRIEQITPFEPQQ